VLWSTRPFARVWPSGCRVNNAGTNGRLGPITDQTARSYAATSTECFSGCPEHEARVRVIQAQGSGRQLANISSTYGHAGAAGASVLCRHSTPVRSITKSVAPKFANRDAA